MSDAYLSIHFDKGTCKGRLDVALRDLEVAVGLDANKDGVITWEELEARQKETEAYAKARLGFESGGTEIPIAFKDLLVDFHGDGGYAVIAFELTGAKADASMRVAYN